MDAEDLADLRSLRAVRTRAALASSLVSAPSLRVCFFGDSYTAGVGDATALGWVGRVLAAARSEGVDVTGYNLGVRRETVPQIQRRWLREARPRLRHGDGHGVVFAGGINDTTSEGGRQRVPLLGTLRALDRFAQQVDEVGWPALVIGPALVADPEQNRRIALLSTVLAERCGDLALPYVEIAAAVDDADWLREVESLDGAHPSSRGYERLADLIRPAFRAWLDTLVDAPAASRH